MLSGRDTPFDEDGFALVIQDVRRLALLVAGGANDLNAGAVDADQPAINDASVAATVDDITQAIADHVAETNPHTQYALQTEVDAAIAALGTMSTQDASAVAITGGSITGITDLALADGGTGASDAAGARSNLGLGTIATQAANNVAITGGSITGITDLAVADGGTGASTAAAARTNLGLGTMATQAASAVAITGGTATLSSLTVDDGFGTTVGVVGSGDLTVSGTTVLTLNDGAVPGRIKIPTGGRLIVGGGTGYITDNAFGLTIAGATTMSGLTATTGAFSSGVTMAGFTSSAFSECTAELRITSADFRMAGSATCELACSNLLLSGTTTGFFGSAGTTRPTITGSKGGNAALTSLMTALASLGLVTNSTT